MAVRVRQASSPQQSGQSASALPRIPRTSDFDFLGNGYGIVDLDAEVPHCAFHSLMAKRLGFILRVSYLIESQRSAAHRSVLAAVRRSCSRRKKLDQPH